jgi:two-component system, cell cycle response regulator
MNTVMSEWDGEKTEMVRMEDIQEPGSTTKKSAHLISLKGPKAGQSTKLSSHRILLGRSADADILLDDEGVSRRHAQITVQDADYWIEDLGSTNGILVNGEKVKRAILSDSDRIQVGTNVLLKFTFQDELEESYQKKLYEQATKDALTGVHNKKYFVDHLKTEFAYAYRHHEPLSLILLDIDFFKKVNDTYGHLAGDAILKEMSVVVDETLREEDLFARYGGEEFAVVLKNTDMQHAVLIAERLRVIVASHEYHFDGQKIPVSISLGVSTLINQNHLKPIFLVQEADHRLYEAKSAGRNKVMPSHHTN